MTEAIDTFFASLPVLAKRMLPGPTGGVLRVDLVEPGRTEHWYLTLAPRSVTVAREGDHEDAVFATNPQLFDRLVRGEAQVTAAVFRNEASYAGSGVLILAFRRFFPDPPGTRDPREAVREQLRYQR